MHEPDQASVHLGTTPGGFAELEFCERIPCDRVTPSFTADDLAG